MAFQEATCSFKAGQITQFEKQSSWERTRFPLEVRATYMPEL
jgi:hypothetical protein